MRLSRHRIRARVKGDLSIEFTDEALTSYSGLELFRRFLDRFWAKRLNAIFADREFDCDYSSWRMTLCVIALLIVGGSRVAHLAQLQLKHIVDTDLLEALGRGFQTLDRHPEDFFFVVEPKVTHDGDRAVAQGNVPERGRRQTN